AAYQHSPDGWRHGYVTNAGGDSKHERFSGQELWRAHGPPTSQHKNERDIARGIHGERRRRSRRRDDRATDRGAYATSNVEAHAVDRDGARQVRSRHHVADRRLPRRTVERRAAAD